MRVFVTGASGWIGSATVSALLGAGHRVVGYARSDAAAAKVVATGAEVRRGALEDLDALRAGAAESEAVVHLGYSHDFSRMAEAAELDRRAIEVLGTALEGTGRPLVVASGMLGLAPGKVATEEDSPDPAVHTRAANARVALSFAPRGVRSSIVRFAPTVHGAGDYGFIAFLVGIAREKGVSGYVGDGSNAWPAVARSDAARLVHLALERAPAGAVLHGVAEEGVPTRSIAEVIGRRLGVPAVRVEPELAAAHFGWLGRIFAADCRGSSTRTRELLGWEPTEPGLLEDLERGRYFDRP